MRKSWWHLTKITSLSVYHVYHIVDCSCTTRIYSPRENPQNPLFRRASFAVIDVSERMRVETESDCTEDSSWTFDLYYIVFTHSTEKSTVSFRFLIFGVECILDCSLLLTRLAQGTTPPSMLVAHTRFVFHPTHQFRGGETYR